jgi:membrane protein implicated in regulation of membrane protease activity
LGALFVAALIVGLGMILAQLFVPGDAHADGDVGDGPEATAILPDGGPGGHGSGLHHPLSFIWRLRFWTFASLGFGLLGCFLYYLDLTPPLVSLIAASVMGAASGALASLTFMKLSNELTNSGAESKDLVGQLGRVLLAKNAEGTLKVRVRVRGQLIDYLASSDELALEAGASVLVEEVRGERLVVSAAPADLKFTE